METNSALCFLGSQTGHGLCALLSQESGDTAILETLVALHAIQSALKFERCSQNLKGEFRLKCLLLR